MHTTLTLNMPSGTRSFTEYQNICLHLAAKQLACNSNQIEIDFPPQVTPKTIQTVTVRPKNSTTPAQPATQHTPRQKLATAIAICIMCLMCMVCLFSIGYTYQHLSHLQHTQQQNADTIAANQAAIAQAKQPLTAAHPTPTPTSTHNGKTNNTTPQTSAAPDPVGAAQRHIAFDLNPVFQTIESITLPNVRLRSLSLDVQPPSAQLVYELANLTQLPTLNSALNKAHPLLQWQLKTVTTNIAQWQGNWLTPQTPQ